MVFCQHRNTEDGAAAGDEGERRGRRAAGYEWCFLRALKNPGCANEGMTKNRQVGNLETRVMTVTSAEKNYVYISK